MGDGFDVNTGIENLEYVQSIIHIGIRLISTSGSSPNLSQVAQASCPQIYKRLTALGIGQGAPVLLEWLDLIRTDENPHIYLQI